MKEEYIEIIGGNENNLKNIDLRIPKGKITVFTGVSGSGKSSIVFDTIAQEAGRQLNETYSNYTRIFLPRYRRPKVEQINNLATAIVIDQKQLGGNARSTLGTITDINSLLRLLFSRFASPHLGYSNAYSFNDPTGMCATCEGIGRTVTLNLRSALDLEKSLTEGAILLPGYGPTSWLGKSYLDSGFFDNHKPIKDYTPSEFHQLVYASGEKIALTYKNEEFNSTYEGLATRFMRQNVQTEKDMSKTAQKKLEQFTEMALCPTCEGKRYCQDVLTSTIDGYSIYDLTALELDNLLEVIQTFAIPEAHTILTGILSRVENLCEIGLGYICLERETTSLSGGESQRVKMVKHLSSSLSGLLYIFDEPSTGLHPRDVYRLNQLLQNLRDRGNTILVVEHDPDVIKIADFIVDVGPHAGTAGGEITYTGSYPDLLTSQTLTGDYLARQLPLKETIRPSHDFLESPYSSLHNLKNINLAIPKNVLTVITGVAGSGKSTLVNEVFAPHFSEVTLVDQSSIHANSRSNPATYLDIMTGIRKLFAEANKVEAGLFSYNSIGGCQTCKGTGVIELNLSFMDKAEVICTSCQGQRYEAVVLQHTYQAKNIVDVMTMTVAEAANFFTTPALKRKLDSLNTVGLGYLTLGQPLNTLSGGECQRLKLAKELKRKGNIYILDEPTTGLHPSDVENFLTIMNQLVEEGNTVIIIEHNLDVMRQGDWLIDLGPDSGKNGGQIVYQGPPAGILTCQESITANYLK